MAVRGWVSLVATYCHGMVFAEASRVPSPFRTHCITLTQINRTSEPGDGFVGLSKQLLLCP